MQVMEVPGFDIKKTIGKGGMGTVYLAVQESLGRDVVLKTMNTTHAEQTDFLERFLNEGRTVAALRHPNIITVFDIGATEDLVYMSMEYVEGGDLKNRIQSGCTPADALRIMEGVAGALDFAHKEGVIHRDVKPANILFKNDGTPLLSDFGIAKHTKVDAELTSTGTILGSPFYMSPEQAEGQKVDGRADIYSLGVIFYEMLTGDRPYPGDSAIKIIVQHIQSPIPTLPAEFKQFQPLLDHMLAKNRDDRPTDAAKVVEAVQSLRHQTDGAGQAGAAGDTAKAAGKTEKARKRGKEKQRIVALLATLVGLLLGFGGVYVYTETIKSSHIARHTPGVDGAGSGSASTASAVKMPPESDTDADRTQIGGKSVSKQQFADALAQLAWLKFKQGRLTDPPGDNAHFYYSRLIKYDPKRAAKGFSDIAERYLALATKAFAARDYRQAQTYVTLGLQVRPNHAGLHKLGKFIDRRQRSVVENILDFFSGNG